MPHGIREIEEDALGLVPRPVTVGRRSGCFTPGAEPTLAAAGFDARTVSDVRDLLSGAFGRSCFCLDSTGVEELDVHRAAAQARPIFFRASPAFLPSARTWQE